MENNIATAIISASGSVLVAVVAILTNNKRIEDTKELFRSEIAELRAEVRHGFERMELLLKLHEAEHHRN